MRKFLYFLFFLLFLAGQLFSIQQAGAEETMICADVITRAKNAATGEVKDFPDACLPSGWVKSQAPDLIIKDISWTNEDQNYSDTFRVRYCNMGGPGLSSGNERFSIKLSSQLKTRMIGGDMSNFWPPAPGACMTAQGGTTPNRNILGLSGASSALLTAEIDPERKVNESNKLNNSFSKTVEFSSSPNGEFRIDKVEVRKEDSLGQLRDDQFSLWIKTSHSFRDITVSVYKLYDNAVPVHRKIISGNGSLTSALVHVFDLNKSLDPEQTYQFIVSAARSSDGAEIEYDDLVNIGKYTPEPDPSLQFSVSPDTVVQGQQATLTWSSINVARCQSYVDEKNSSDEWVWNQNDTTWTAETGARAVNGSLVVSPQKSTKYWLNCFNKVGKQVSKTITVNVGAVASFAVETHRLDKPKMSDGTSLEADRDFYITFNKPAKDVTLNVYKKSTNTLLQTYAYPSYLYQSGQKNFAVGSVMNLLPNTTYHYEISGKDIENGAIGKIEGNFTTGIWQGSTPKPEEKKSCAQVITRARNKVTGDLKDFPTPCDIPTGWEVVSQDIAIKQQDDQIVKIEKKVEQFKNSQIDLILVELNELRSKVKEQESEIKFLKKVSGDFQKLNDEMRGAVSTFVTYGIDDNTKKLGAGERAAVINSYKVAFNKLPDTDEELQDLFRIANGRFPSKTNVEAEKNAKAEFRKIYKRVANMINPNDSAAVTVMAYGLRQSAENRNLKSESAGIAIFKKIYGRMPQTTEDWNIMQAITYSGASRKADTDKDGLSDEDEKTLGTDINNQDSDADGYLDGVEVENGFDPKKA